MAEILQLFETVPKEKVDLAKLFTKAWLINLLMYITADDSDMAKWDRLWIVPMSLRILYPQFGKQYAEARVTPNNQQIITVEDRPIEDYVSPVADLYFLIRHKRRIVLTDFHQDLMAAERLAMQSPKATFPVQDMETGEISHEVQTKWVRKETRRILREVFKRDVQGYDVTVGLGRIMDAYVQADVMGYDVKFRDTQAKPRKVQKVA